MLWAYFDESGVHDRASGKLVKLALGGFLARYADWLCFERQWGQALMDERISHFHMADFENYVGEFQNWTKDRHQAFLSRLLEIIHDNIQSIVGAGCFVSSVDEPLSESYLNNVTGAIHSALHESRFWAFPSEKTSVILAIHPEVSGRRIGQYFDAIKAGVGIDILESFSVDDPHTLRRCKQPTLPPTRSLSSSRNGSGGQLDTQ